MKFYRSLYLMKNLFVGVGVVACFFVLGSFNNFLLRLAEISLFVLLGALISEIILLYRSQSGIQGDRDVQDRLSNGDENSIYINLLNKYTFKVFVNLIDELPVQFQVRDKNFDLVIGHDDSKIVKYSITPKERGVYNFGNINLYVSTYLRLIQRRYIIEAEKEVAVYPSFIQMKKYAFLAISDDLQQAGIKKIRKIGHNYEFDQIRDFVIGDDYRSINWKATAKRNSVMVNQYQDEKSQNIVALINKGRVMKMPFEEMTLLDHAINSSLVLLNVACQKDDHAGLITFNKDIDTVLAPSSNRRQMMHVQEMLFNQTTDFTEANYEKLYMQVRHVLKRRSLIFLYTNFESLQSLRRELPYLRSIAKYHRLIVVFFRNTELNQLLQGNSESLEDIYIKTIAGKFQFEKDLIVKELHRNGIDSVLTSPSGLTVNSINKYLEIKAKFLV